MLRPVAKVILVTVLVGAAILVAGLTGVLFRLWPTFLNDHPLPITPQTLEQLQALKRERKFLPDGTRWYPGPSTDNVREAAQRGIDAIIDDLLTTLPRTPQRSVVLSAFKAGLPAFDRLDSEEQDQALLYCEQIMRIVGVTSSGELLNVWRYGLPLGWPNPILRTIALAAMIASALGANRCWFRMVRAINAVEPKRPQRWRTFFARSIFSVMQRHARLQPDSSLRAVTVLWIVATVVCFFCFAALD